MPKFEIKRHLRHLPDGRTIEVKQHTRNATGGITMDNSTDERLEISFGRRTFPDDVRAVWGARLIWPDDLLWDRQDLDSRSDEDKEALIAWLNGPNRGDGAIAKMKETLRNAMPFTGQSDESEAVLYEDEQGKIIGSPQGSFGYVYVAGFLK